jgi:hypothetical protein
MAFGQDFLSAFFGNEFLKDYGHATKTFRTNGYENSPRYKFLFHVYFNINTTEIPALANVFDNNEASTVGLLVKTIDLPRYNIDVETLNQYNRKRLVQKKINYEPVTIKFHDDGGDLIRTMWYNYFSYYYKDPSQKYGNNANTAGTSGPNLNTPAGFSYNDRDQYAASRIVNDWGFVGESYSDGTNSSGGKPAFFRDITIFGFNQHKFAQYTLINPLITAWNHDNYDYSQGDGVMENTMTINYETVKYAAGAIGGVRPDTNVTGFADPNYYDQVRSPLTRPGGTQSILGQGGLLDAGIGIVGDLQAIASGRGGLNNVIGAVQTAGTAYGTFKGKDLQSVAREEALGAVKDVLRANTNPGGVRAQPNGQANSPMRAPVFLIPPRR